MIPTYLIELCKTRFLTLNKDKLKSLDEQIIKDSSDNFYNFPITKGKMYGGALMANSVANCLENGKLLNFKTSFFYPTDEKSDGETKSLKEGANFKWVEFIYTSKAKSRLSARTTALIDLSVPFEGDASKNESILSYNPHLKNNNIPVPVGEAESILSSNPNFTNDNIPVPVPFNIFMLNFFESIDTEFQENHKSYRESNGFLDFLDFLTETFDLAIQSTSPFKISYSISKKCPEDEISNCLIYLIDILMVCYAGIPSKQPIHNNQKIIFSSIEHEMNFIKNIANSLKRNGIIEFSLLSCPQGNSFYFVAAEIFSENKICFCQALQIVNLAPLRKSTKSKL